MKSYQLEFFLYCVFWQKLSETKLASLYTDLQLQDKEEIKLKRLKSEGQDKDGLIEAGVRKKLRCKLDRQMIH